MPTTVQETTPMEIDELSQAANTATNNNDNNGTSTSVSPRPVANTASLQLQQIKQHFNPGCLKNRDHRLHSIVIKLKIRG